MTGFLAARARIGLLLAATFLAALCAVAPPAHAADVRVYAAASLKNALDDAGAAYLKATGVKVVPVYDASGTLAKQIENGAPADLFISADLAWMDYLQGKALIRADSRINLLGNRLVLIAPAGGAAHVDLKPGVHLAALLGDGRLALGDPASVPAGAYARAALQWLGDWATLQPRLAPTANVRAALALVSRGEAPLGIVYETDVAADKGVRIAGIFPAESHPPIVYPIALTASTTKPAAGRYRAWLASPAAAPFFERQGFRVLPHGG